MSRVLILLILAALTACSRAPDGTRSEVGLLSLFDPVAANPSLCGGPAIPYPNNALFSGTTDATLNIPNPAGAPFVTAANLTDGFSTTASIFTDVLGDVDFETAPGAVMVFEADASPRFLAYGVDYTLQPSIAMAQVSGTGHSTGTCTGVLPAKFQPIADQRARIMIEPLKPLNPSTTYIVAVTRDLKSRDGIEALPNEFFSAVNTDTKLCKLAGAETGSEALCTDGGAGAAAAAATGISVLALMDAAKLTTLETLRRQLVRPTVTALKGAHSALGRGTLADEDIVIAWSFTTQSVGLTLSRLNSSVTPAAFQVANTTISTGDLGVGLADTADIYAGIIQVPYYLKNTDASPADPLTGFWTSNGTLNTANPPALGGAVPCSVLAPSTSTTLCYPDPMAQSTETIPVLVTVPNGNSGRTKPEAGWPVVVFQHGITRNRTDMLAIAPTLAAAGFVTVAIDIPLHGVANNNPNPLVNPFYRNQVFTGSPAAGLMTGERTFDLDLVDNTPDPNPCAPANAQPDGVIDASGTHFVNLASLITSRDNLRQAEADILHLARSMGSLDLDNNPGALTASDIDETRIHFVGQSLGAIVGTTVLGTIDDSLIQAGSLNVPGGGIAKLLDASAAFGPRVSAGLSCNGVFEGTDTYETFERFAQHLVDPADPINFAAAASANHPIHLVQVIGDAVVPNNAGSTCPAPFPAGLEANATTVDLAGTVAASAAAGALMLAECPPLVLPPDPPLAQITYQDETLMTGFLSGTDPLVAMMGLDTLSMGNVPFAAKSNPGPGTAVQFAPDTAEHGTLLTPDSSAVSGADSTFLAGTCEMQKQTASFLASNGTLIAIGGSCP